MISAAADQLGVLGKRGGPEVPAVRVALEQLRLEIVDLLAKLEHRRRLVGVGAGSGWDGGASSPGLPGGLGGQHYKRERWFNLVAPRRAALSG